MNEFDPMNQDRACDEPTHDDHPHTDPTQNHSTYTQSSPNPASVEPSGGQSYTTPDGSHGCIYNSDSRQNDKIRGYRGALIGVSVVLVAVLLGVMCLFGAWMAARSLRNDSSDGSSDRSEVGTSGGLYIAGGTEDANGPSAIDVGEGVVSLGSETAPSRATIQKNPPQREDANSDGRSDIAYDKNGEVITSAGDAATTVATVVARVSASVVEITTETITQSGFIGQYVTSGAGSGVIVSREGFIVTNHHVIDGANTITVRLNNGTEYAAALVGSDSETDIAVLWINANENDLTVATLGSSRDLVVGEDIIAIGNPLGSLGGTVTEGMVSATARQISVSGSSMTLLQVSAPINPGNSGGGLFNLAGDLIGVVNAKMSSEEIEGLGFAIPVDTAYEIIVELIEHGYVRGRPSLGATVVNATQQAARQYFGSNYAGVYVYDEGHAVLEYGDRIVAVGNQEITTSDELRIALRAYKVGDNVTLQVYRGGRLKSVSVKLAESVPEK